MNIPILSVQMTRQPDVIISGDIIEKCAAHIKDNASISGFFNDVFAIEDDSDEVEFMINCKLFYKPEIGRECCTGVLFYSAYANTWDEDGNALTNDFTETELSDYLKDIKL